ncbi:MAG: hypothetical protein Q8P45_00135 [Candidatus Harrisonbacteria bacterium]|nr:hypothetical protein [Candidatus Harrisonbacteria bacterium]
MNNKNRKPLSRKIRSDLDKILQTADAKRKYRWAIDLFEKYRKHYQFDDDLEYRLGLLYDHLVIFKISRKKDTKSKNLLSKKYLKKAQNIYQEIHRKNPEHFLALHGLRRIHEISGNYKQAIKFGIKAYELTKKLPKTQRRALAVGNIFYLKGDFKNAEKWFKKELVSLGENNLSANANLLMFYNDMKAYKKALPYALKTEKLLRMELKKGIYKNLRTPRTNKTLELITAHINKAKFANKMGASSKPPGGTTS